MGFRFSLTRRPIDRKVLLEILCAGFGSIAFALAFGYWVLINFSKIGLQNDLDYQMQLHWVPFYTVTHFHQFPLWNPYKCGGMPMLGNPQSRILTPFFLPFLLFGPVIGLHIEIVAHIAIGFAGAYYLGRVLGLSPLGAIACAGSFAGSSWYYLHLASGHAVFMASAYIPWIVALFYRGGEVRRLTPAVFAGLLMALIFMEGGIYAVPQTALILTILTLMICVQKRTVFPPLVLAATGVFAVAFSAPKLLPTLHLLSISARAVDAFEVNSIPMFVQELFSRHQEFPRSLAGGFWGFHEYAAYIGVIIAFLAVLGAATNFWRTLPWSVLSLIVLSLAAGNWGPYAPWILLHHVPLFEAQHAPTRILIFFTLTAGVLAGFGIDALSRLGWLGTSVAAILVALSLADFWMVNSYNLAYTIGGAQEPFPTSATFRQMLTPDDHHMFMMSLANLGATNCYEPASASRAAYGYNQPGYRGEVHLIGAGEVSLVRWTPNELEYDVDARDTATVVINQSFDSEWKLVEGKGLLGANNGLLAVRVPAGKQRLELRYYSRSFLLGCAIFLLGLLAAVAVRFVERRLFTSSLESQPTIVKSTEAPESQVENT